jgi:hypothetical protein
MEADTWEEGAKENILCLRDRKKQKDVGDLPTV